MSAVQLGGAAAIAQDPACNFEIHSIHTIELETQFPLEHYVDLDGDRVLDRVEHDSVAQQFLWRPGLGDGTFGATSTIPLHGPSSFSEFADLDGDRDLDLVLIDRSNDRIRVLTNTGDQQFELTQVQWMPEIKLGPEVWDIDRDGDLDVIVENGPRSIAVLLNEGEDVWTLTTQEFISINAFVFDYADMNSDGAVDLVLTRSGFGGYVEKLVSFNDGGGIFLPPISVHRGPQHHRHVIIDANGDSFLDLIVFSDETDVYHGSQSGAFVHSQSFGMRLEVRDHEIQDLNHDGADDFFFIERSIPGPYQFFVVLSNGAGEFDILPAFPEGHEFTNFLYVEGSEDFDGDGRIDLLLTYSGSVWIALSPPGGWGVENPTLFQLPFDFWIRTGPSGLVDLTGDGRKDIEGYSKDTEKTYVIPTTPDRLYEPRVLNRMPDGSLTAYFEFVDIDGSKGPDMFVSDYWSKTYMIRWNNGRGEFLDSEMLNPEIPYGSVAWGNLNEDEHPDFVVRWSESSREYLSRYHGGEDGFELVGSPMPVDGAKGRPVLADFTGSPADELFMRGDLDGDLSGRIWESDPANSGWVEWATFGPNAIDGDIGIWTPRLAGSDQRDIIYQTKYRLMRIPGVSGGHYSTAEIVQYDPDYSRNRFLVVDYANDGFESLVRFNPHEREMAVLEGDGSGGLRGRDRVTFGTEYYSYIVPITTPTGGFGDGFVVYGDSRMGVIERDSFGALRLTERFGYYNKPLFSTIDLRVDDSKVYARNLRVLDLDSDGDMDVVRQNEPDGNFWLHTNRCTDPCRPDLNFDFVVDQADLHVFVDLWLSADAEADFNGDGILDIGDIGAFITTFLAGC